MKNFTIYLIIYLIPNFTVAQKSDSLAVDIELAKIKVSLDKIENQSKRIQDSLSRELIFYKIKEDYFANAIEQQTTLYATIVGSITFMFGLLGYGIFRYEINRIENRMRSHVDNLDKKNEKQTKKLEYLERDAYSNEGNLNASLAQTFRQNEAWDSAARYSVSAAFSFSKYLATNTKHEPEEFTRHCNIIRSNLENCLFEIEQSEEIEDINWYQIQLDFIHKKGNDEVKTKCAELRVRLNQVGEGD